MSAEENVHLPRINKDSSYDDETASTSEPSKVIVHKHHLTDPSSRIEGSRSSGRRLEDVTRSGLQKLNFNLAVSTCHNNPTKRCQPVSVVDESAPSTSVCTQISSKSLKLPFKIHHSKNSNCKSSEHSSVVATYAQQAPLVDEKNFENFDTVDASEEITTVEDKHSPLSGFNDFLDWLRPRAFSDHVKNRVSNRRRSSGADTGIYSMASVGTPGFHNRLQDPNFTSVSQDKKRDSTRLPVEYYSSSSSSQRPSLTPTVTTSTGDEGFVSIEDVQKPLFVDTKMANAWVASQRPPFYGAANTDQNRRPPLTVDRRESNDYEQNDEAFFSDVSSSFNRRALSINYDPFLAKCRFNKSALGAAAAIRRRRNSEFGRYLIMRRSLDPGGVNEFVAQLEDSSDKAYCQLLCTMKCYDLMPPLSKMVVLDSELTMRKVFNALMRNGIRAALVKKSGEGSLLGLLTFTDLLRMLRQSISDGNLNTSFDEPLKNFISCSSVKGYQWPVIFSNLSNASRLAVDNAPVIDVSEISDESSLINRQMSMRRRYTMPASSLLVEVNRRNVKVDATTLPAPRFVQVKRETNVDENPDVVHEFLPSDDFMEGMGDDEVLSQCPTVNSNSTFLNGLIHVYSDTNLYDVTKLLCEKRVHRVIVFDSETNLDPVFLLSKRMILQDLHKYISNLRLPCRMNTSLYDLRIGTWSNFITVRPDTALIECLDVFIDTGLSILPILATLDDRLTSVVSHQHPHFPLQDSLTKTDIVDFVFSEFGGVNPEIDLLVDKSAQDILSWKRSQGSSTRHITCHKHTPVVVAVDSLLRKNARCLVVVDDRNCLEGVVTVGDLMRYLIAS